MLHKIKRAISMFVDRPLYSAIIIIDRTLISPLLYWLIPDKYYLIKYRGGKIYLNLRESMMMRFRAMGIYESEKTKLFQRIIKPGMTVLDIGANKGYFSLLAAKLTTEIGHVYTFEPNPENCEWIRKSIGVNHYKNIKLFQIALFNKNTTMPFFYGKKSGHHSLIYDQEMGSKNVQVARLDDIIRKNNITDVDFIKIDVEGAELGVLEGSKKLLKKQSPKIVIDIHDINRKKFYKILDDCGYKLFYYDKKKLRKLSANEFINGDIFEVYAESVH